MKTSVKTPQKSKIFVDRQQAAPASPETPVKQVAVIGLGYVGLPLACAFARRLPTLGFDIDVRRIAELKKHSDRNGEIGKEALENPRLTFHSDPAALKAADFIIVAVPTPSDAFNRPDLGPVIEASRLVARNLSKGAVVVFESTVYPGVTEETCLPILAELSGLKPGVDFHIGYSPERINPGDAAHALETVVKIVSAQDAKTLDKVAAVYSLVALGGVYRAPDIRTAEAAKAIENVQRDLNIALMNELSILFGRMNLNTWEVLKAARTKWNFLPFEPGLVGGHCIPVDPYYLTHKAQEVGYHPEVILAGRRVNDEMGRHVARETVKLMIKSGKAVKGARVLVLGLTFKENVKDVRNSRVFELIEELAGYGIEVSVHDPLVDVARFGFTAADSPFDAGQVYDAVVLAVPHRAFKERPTGDYLTLLDAPKTSGSVLADVKAILDKPAIERAGTLYWSL